MRKSLNIALLGLSASLLIAPLHAQASSNYPNQPISLLVGYAPGGSVDIVARAYAQRLGTLLGQSIVVENRGGASGTIAAQAVVNARPDGYTLYFAASPTITITPAIQKVTFDPLKDFQPVAPVVSYTNVLLVNSNSPYQSLHDLVEGAKKAPGSLTYGSAGVGASNHLSGEQLAQHASVQLTHVPYKGNAPALTDLLAGRITMLFDLNTTAANRVKSGQVRALAVTSGSRNAMFPDTPTMKESGYPEFEFDGWLSVIGPADMPADVVDTLYEATQKVLGDPDFQEQMAASGYTIMHETPQEMSERIRHEGEIFDELAASANLRQY